MNQNGTIIFYHEQAGSSGEVGFEPTYIIYGTFSYYKTHSITLTAQQSWKQPE
ncbi:hypothetical protein GCM10009567_08820 [Rothia amarae]